jgi:integrase
MGNSLSKEEPAEARPSEISGGRQRGTGSVYRQPGSRNLWIKYYKNGRAFRESTHTGDRRKAEQKLKQRLAEIATGQFIGLRVERILVSDLADDFLRDYRINGRKSLDDAESRWNLHLKPYFGMFKVVEISSDLVARYVDKRQQQKAKNGTINRELAVLKRMFSLGQKATPPKVLRRPAFPTLQENNVRKGFLEDAESRKLIASNPELWFRCLVELGRTYGWRVGELLGLRVRHVDLLQRTIRLEPGTTKNRDGRQVTMTTPVYELLEQCVHGKAPDAHVITRANGRPVRDFRGAWASACESAGVPGLLFHDLRRTAARNLRRAGVAEGVIMKIGGWRTRSVFERYAIVSQQDIADAMCKLEKAEFGHSFGHSGAESSAVAELESVQ